MWLIVRSMNFFLWEKFWELVNNHCLCGEGLQTTWGWGEAFVFHFLLSVSMFGLLKHAYALFLPFKHQRVLSGWYTHGTWLSSLVFSNIFKVFVSLKINYVTKKYTVLQYSKYWTLSKIVFLRMWRPHAYYLLLKGHLGLSDWHSLPFIFLECMPGIHNLPQS